MSTRVVAVRRRMFTYCGLLFAVLSFSAQADLVIYQFDVGMGDATLIVDTSTGRSLLMDAGGPGKGKKVIVPALKTLGMDNINYFIASHYDADHIGGFDEIVNAGIKIPEGAFDRGASSHRKKKTKTGRDSQYGQYVKAAEFVGQHAIQPSCDTVITLGEETRVEVVASSGAFLNVDCSIGNVDIHPSKGNDLSVALVIRQGDFSYFIGGDLTGGGNNTTDMESKVSARVGDVDVLHLNHHGSETSNNPDFLTALSPEVVVISVGDGGVNKRYKLPRQPVLDRVSSLTNPPAVFLTNKGEGGTYPGALVVPAHINIHTDGNAYSVNGHIYSVDERSQHNEPE